MTAELAALILHARTVPAEARTTAAVRLRDADRAGCVVLETCHRVEVFGAQAAVCALADLIDAPAEIVTGDAVAKHVVSLAVGRASAVIGEDQVLHQLRVAVADARARHGLSPELDRLFDVAFRAGRRARSWMPGRRPSLADVALDLGLAIGDRPGPILVVGAGEMGRLAARAAASRGRGVVVASRSASRAEQVAASVGGTSVALDPGGARLTSVVGVVVALRGSWSLAPASSAALLDARPWVVDLSAPPAVDRALSTSLGTRFVSIDDLAARPVDAPALTDLGSRLDRLVETAVEDYRRWLADEPARSAARELAGRAEEATTAELGVLWSRRPGMDLADRAEVERMAQRLARRLLRVPLERLHDDLDGRKHRAARELFGL